MSKNKGEYWVLKKGGIDDGLYFVGVVPGYAIGIVWTVSPIILNAFDFDSQSDAAECRDDLNLGKEWTPVRCWGGSS